MCRQCHKLVELISGEEGAEIVGRLSFWAHVEITNDKGGFLKVDELLQEMFGPEQRFLLGAIYGDDVHIVKGDFPELDERLPDLVVAEVGRLVLHINSNAFPLSHTGEVTLEALKVILFSFLFSRMQPCLLQAKYVTLKQGRITSDIFNVPAEGPHIEGANF